MQQSDPITTDFYNETCSTKDRALGDNINSICGFWGYSSAYSSIALQKEIQFACGKTEP